MSLLVLALWACGEPSSSELWLRAEQYRSAGDDRHADALFRTLCDERQDGDACGKVGLWTRGCTLGSLPSCIEGQERSMGDARLEFAQLACDLSHADSCWIAGTQAAYGRGVSDEVAARRSFAQGCTLGHGLSCLATGDRAHQAGDLQGAIDAYQGGCKEVGDVGCDLAEATRGLRQQVEACEAGDRDACREACPQGGDDTVCALALPEAIQACDRREREGCTLLGHIYGSGRGVEVDLDRANALLWLACDLDDAVACLRLEDNQSRGRGAAPAGSRSVPWLQIQVCDLQMDYGCAPHGFWP